MSRAHVDRQILREAEGYLDLAFSVEGPRDLSLPLRQKLAQRCLTALDRLSDRMGNRVHAQMLRGHSYKLMEAFDEAIAVFQRCAVRDEENIHIYLAMAWCHKRSGHIELAIQALEEALLIDDAEPIIFYNLACYWALVRDVPLTVQYLARAFDLDESLRVLVSNEADFDHVRRDPRFLALTTEGGLAAH